MNTVFISYSHSDDNWKKRIVGALVESYPEFKDILWDDSKLPLGSVWADELAEHRSQATAALILISEAYLLSQSARDEVTHLLSLREKQGLRLIPIILEDCNWRQEPWLQETQIYPPAARPLSSFSPTELVTSLREFAKQLIDLFRASQKKRRRLVILIHGIRTRSEWQGRISDLFAADTRTIVEPAGYDYFDVFRFLCPFWTRRRPVEVVLGKVRAALDLHRTDYDELIIFAHSFGSYILGKILMRNPDIKPERILLCGCILPSSYGWYSLRNRPRVILNEASSRDIWPILARSVTWGYGSTGTFGFLTPGVRDRFHNLAHSDYFKNGFAERYWVRWIQEEKFEPTEYDKSNRPPTPFYKNLFEVIPLKYVGLALILAFGIYAWFLIRGPQEVRLDLGPDVSIGHYTGVPYFAGPLKAKNTTSKEVLITNLQLVLISPRAREIPMKMEAIWVGNQGSAPLNALTLKPKEIVELPYTFFNTNDGFALLHQEVSNFSVRTNLWVPSPDETKAVLPQDMVQRLVNFARSQFIWEPGEWKVRLTADQGGKQLFVIKSFTLSREECDRMWKIADHYASGIGVFPNWRALAMGDYQPILQIRLADSQ